MTKVVSLLWQDDISKFQISPEESVTESESSFDFDLPDESQFLESSIRLTRDDMRSPESDDTKRDSDSDTDHVLSRDDIMPNSTRKYDLTVDL